MMYRTVVRDLAETLAVLLPVGHVAGILDATLNATDDERLTDERAELAELLHDTLSDARPEAVDLAMTGRAGGGTQT